MSLQADGGALRISVTDDGPGIGPVFAATASDRFARDDPNRTTRGSGLDLEGEIAIFDGHSRTRVALR